MKTFTINIVRVFKESGKLIRDKMIRLIDTPSKTRWNIDQLMTKIGWKFVVLSLSSYKKATARIRLYHKFALYLRVMTRRHGGEFTVKYLKACNLAVSKYLAAQPFKSLSEIEPDLPLPRLSKSGLPVIIGTRDRRSLRLNNLSVIRLYLSLFSLYRVILIPGKLKINTITDPFSGDITSLKGIENWMRNHSSSALQSFCKKSYLKAMDKFLISEKSSPTCSKSWVGMISDAILLSYNPCLLNSLLIVMNKTCTPDLINFLNDIIKIAPYKHSFDFFCFILKFKPRLSGEKGIFDLNKRDFGLGQLSEKLEAAGKVRVFAMVDSWTQTATHSLHNYLMDVLNNIPNDGSKDHGAAFVRATQKAVKFNCCYGYDLSAATDRLPISLQAKIIGSLFSDEFAIAWSNLLVGRPYYLFNKDDNDFFPFHYAVGQPMGAKSSWTMLALTHHMLMQYCSKLLNPIQKHWEERYEIVGDDIVIFSKDLALSYLNVMEAIGVPINASKSVVSESRAVCEFVKRISVNGKEVTPLSWKQFLSQYSFLGRINTTIGLFLKEIDFFGTRAVSVFHTVLKDKPFDTRPFKDVLALISLYSTYALKAKVPLEQMLQMLFLAAPEVKDKKLTFKKFDLYQVSKTVQDLVLKRPVHNKNFRVNSKIIFEKAEELLCKRLYKTYQLLKYDKVREGHEKIIGTMLPGMSEFYSNQISIDLNNLLVTFFREVQDPMSGYPELAQVPVQNRVLGRFDHLMKLDLGMFSKIPLNAAVTNSNIGRLSSEFKCNSEFDNCSVNLFGGVIKVIPKSGSSESPLNLAAELLKSWEGKLSFLRIVDRLQDPKVDELRDISDTALLSEFLHSYEMARKDDRWSEGSKKMGMMNISFGSKFDLKF